MKVLGIVGYSGSGKTTLIERLLPVLTARGVRTSVIKHTHHDFEIDRPGKDSWRLRESGAAEVLLASDPEAGSASRRNRQALAVSR